MTRSISLCVAWVGIASLGPLVVSACSGSSSGSDTSGAPTAAPSPGRIPTSTGATASATSSAPGRGECVSGLIAWWRGEGDATDAVGTNHARANGNVSYVPGVVGQAFHFDGNASYLVAPSTGLPQGSAPRTLAAWVRFEVDYTGLTEGLVLGYGSWGTQGGTNEMLLLGSPSTNTMGFSQWGDAVTASGAGQKSTWQHVAVTVDAGTVTLFVNGRSAGSKAMNVATVLESTYLGGHPNPPDGRSEWLAGDVDDAAVYDRALSPSEIAVIASTGTKKCN